MHLSRFLLNLPLGEPMIFALHAEIQDLLLMTPKESATLSLLPFLGGGGVSVGDDASRGALATSFSGNAPETLEAECKVSSIDRVVAIKAKMPRRWPRPQGRNFWSTPPKETPAAEATPAVSAAMKRARDSLPAAKMKGEFLTVMKKAISVGNRVMLVTGETGSGTLQFLCMTNVVVSKLLSSNSWCQISFV